MVTESKIKISKTMCDYITEKEKKELDRILKKRKPKKNIKSLEQQIRRLKEALIWCSGSADFQPEGKARKGWVKICQPLLKK